MNRDRNTPTDWSIEEYKSAARYFQERLEHWQDANREMGERFAAVLKQRDEAVGLLREIAGGRNGSTAPVLAAMRRHAPGLLRDIRVAVVKADLATAKKET